MSASVISQGGGSSAVSLGTRNRVRAYYGARCIICGYPGHTVEVAHIIPRSDPANEMLNAFQKWSTQLSLFRKDHPENLLLLCPNHHREYDAGMITIVPNAAAREYLKKHEEQDWENRQKVTSLGLRDPGRELPFPPKYTVPTGFDYVPVTVPYYLDVHNRTEYLNHTFLMDSQRRLPRHDNPVTVPVYPLLIRATQSLNRPGHAETPFTNAVRQEVEELITLYNRELRPVENLTQIADALAVQASLDSLTPEQLGNTTLATIPEGHHDAAGMGEHEGGMFDDLYDLGSSIETPTDGSDGVMAGGLTTQPMIADLAEYEDEPAATPAVLSSRMRWQRQPHKLGHPDLGSLRFATSSDFVTPVAEPADVS